MIAIIGAGLSGLTAAKILNDQNLDFELYDSSDQIGGRVKTDTVDGFLLDHGFQVLLSSYPQIKKQININDLNVQSFDPGAVILNKENKLLSLSDPLRRPSSIFTTLLSPIGSIIDKVKILQLRLQTNIPALSTDQYLKQFGFSRKVIDLFFKPFFSGVLLDSSLEAPASYFDFLYKRFSTGYATLPKEGMKALPSLIIKDVDKSKIKLNQKIKNISLTGEVTFESLATKKFDHIILATDVVSTNKILQDSNLPQEQRSVTTFYFSSDVQPSESKSLLLNGSNKGLVNHIAFLTNIQPSYSPFNKHLISVTVLGDEDIDPLLIKEEISQWNTLNTSDWSFIKRYIVKNAQPSKFSQGERSNQIGNIIFAGDYMETPSIEGAMLAGEKAAQILCN